MTADAGLLPDSSSCPAPFFGFLNKSYNTGPAQLPGGGLHARARGTPPIGSAKFSLNSLAGDVASPSSGRGSLSSRHLLGQGSVAPSGAFSFSPSENSSIQADTAEKYKPRDWDP